jgi:large subunit ribosomal protein L31e
MVKEYKEKIITVNLRKVFDKPVTKRAKSALFVIKNAVKKETRAENIKISNLVNETVWEKGLFKAPRRITVKVIPGKDGVNVYLPDEKIKSTEEKKKSEDTKSNPKEKAKEAVTPKKENTGVAEVAKEVKEEEKKETPKEEPKSEPEEKEVKEEKN